MKTLSTISLGAFVLATASPVMAEETVEKTFAFEDFSEVAFKGVFDVEISVGGEAYSVQLDGPEEEMDRVSVALDGDQLSFDQSRKKGGGDRKGVDITITMPALNAVTVAGVAEVEVTGIAAEAFSAKLSGVGDVSLEGTCETMDAKVAGVGELDAEKLECSTVDVQVSGVGSAAVFASEDVKARVSGIGEITVYGNPTSVEDKSGFFGSVDIK
ncbi:MAG: head GIN domain-containing protein [Pseudomonadota bacterium]